MHRLEHPSSSRSIATTQSTATTTTTSTTRSSLSTSVSFCSSSIIADTKANNASIMTTSEGDTLLAGLTHPHPVYTTAATDDPEPPLVHNSSSHHKCSASKPSKIFSFLHSKKTKNPEKRHHHNTNRHNPTPHLKPPRSASERPNYSQRNPRTGRRRIHRVSYTPTNHIQVLFQMYGSALPHVLPYCLANVVWTAVIHALKSYNMVDITFDTSSAHSFMAMLISFLAVERVRISYARYMQNRTHLADCYRACREVMQLACSYTFQVQSNEAQQWRQRVAVSTITLLHVTMDVLEYAGSHKSYSETLVFPTTTTCERDREEEDNNRNTKKDPEECRQSIKFCLSDETTSDNDDEDEEFDQEEDRGGDVECGGTVPSTLRKRNTKGPNTNKAQSSLHNQHLQALREFSHGDRTLLDETFRAPLLYEYNLREIIMQHPDYLGYKLHANEYRDLVLAVSAFNKAFHGFRVLLLTPYPFSLVQMTRWFLLFWVYSLPLVLVAQMDILYHTLIMIFLITFGFIGTEYVSVTLDDPFGHGVNDVDQTGMSELVFEDVYLTLYKVDGLEAARAVKHHVMKRFAVYGRGLQAYQADFGSDGFWQNNPPHGPLWSSETLGAQQQQQQQQDIQDNTNDEADGASTTTRFSNPNR